MPFLYSCIVIGVAKETGRQKKTRREISQSQTTVLFKATHISCRTNKATEPKGSHCSEKNTFIISRHHKHTLITNSIQQWRFSIKIAFRSDSSLFHRWKKNILLDFVRETSQSIFQQLKNKSRASLSFAIKRFFPVKI